MKNRELISYKLTEGFEASEMQYSATVTRSKKTLRFLIVAIIVCAIAFSACFFALEISRVNKYNSRLNNLISSSQNSNNLNETQSQNPSTGSGSSTESNQTNASWDSPTENYVYDFIIVTGFYRVIDSGLVRYYDAKLTKITKKYNIKAKEAKTEYTFKYTSDDGSVRSVILDDIKDVTNDGGAWYYFKNKNETEGVLCEGGENPLKNVPGYKLYNALTGGSDSAPVAYGSKTVNVEVRAGGQYSIAVHNTSYKYVYSRGTIDEINYLFDGTLGSNKSDVTITNHIDLSYSGTSCNFRPRGGKVSIYNFKSTSMFFLIYLGSLTSLSLNNFSTPGLLLMEGANKTVRIENCTFSSGWYCTTKHNGNNNNNISVIINNSTLPGELFNAPGDSTKACNITIESGSYSNTNLYYQSDTERTVYILNKYANLTISGGTFNCLIENYKTLNITGGTFNGGTYYFDYEIPSNGKIINLNYESSLRNYSTATCTISGSSNFKDIVENYGTCTINGGTFTGVYGGGTFTVNGGTFEYGETHHSVEVDYMSQASASVINEYGSLYTYGYSTNQIKITGGIFNAFYDCYYNIKISGGTFNNGVGYYSYYSGYKATISGGTFKGVVYNSDTSGVMDITNGIFNGVKNSGTLTISGGEFGAGNMWVNSTLGWIDVGLSNSAIATINGGTFTGDIRNFDALTINNGTYNCVVYNDNGTTTINGGTFNGVDGRQNSVKNYKTLNINGGTFGLVVYNVENDLNITSGSFNLIINEAGICTIDGNISAEQINNWTTLNISNATDEKIKSIHNIAECNLNNVKLGGDYWNGTEANTRDTVKTTITGSDSYIPTISNYSLHTTGYCLTIEDATVDLIKNKSSEQTRISIKNAVIDTIKLYSMAKTSSKVPLYIQGSTTKIAEINVSNATKEDGVCYYIADDSNMALGTASPYKVTGVTDYRHVQKAVSYIVLDLRIVYIDNLEDLMELNGISIPIQTRAIVSGHNRFILTNDITVPVGTEWNGITSFSRASFEGGGNAITFENSNIGLFETLGVNAIVKDLTIRGNIINNTNISSVGALAQIATNCDIYECENYANIEANNALNIGGFIGQATDCYMDYSSNYGNITSLATSNIGGIIGLAINLETYGCENHAYIQANNASNIGGIIGQFVGNDDNYYLDGTNYGNITGELTSNIGGIVGKVELQSDFFVYISNSKNYGDLTMGEYIGGIVGYSNSGVEVFNCYVNCQITEAEYAAGIVCGYKDAYIANCIVEGDFSAKKYVAGIVFVIFGEQTWVDNCVCFAILQDESPAKTATMCGIAAVIDVSSGIMEICYSYMFGYMQKGYIICNEENEVNMCGYNINNLEYTNDSSSIIKSNEAMLIYVKDNPVWSASAYIKNLFKTETETILSATNGKLNLEWYYEFDLDFWGEVYNFTPSA